MANHIARDHMVVCLVDIILCDRQLHLLPETFFENFVVHFEEKVSKLVGFAFLHEVSLVVIL